MLQLFARLIVLPDGSKEGIALLPHTAGRVTLGIATSPDGDDTHHLTTTGKARDKWRLVATRANVWLDRLKNRHLPPQISWVLYRLQLWSSIWYGLGTLSAPLSMLGELSTNFAFRALPFLSVNRQSGGICIILLVELDCCLFRLKLLSHKSICLCSTGVCKYGSFATGDRLHLLSLK